MKNFLWIGLAILFLSIPFNAFAQEVTLGTALPVQINENVQDGDIISTSAEGGFVRSHVPYESFLFGVISLHPALNLYEIGAKNEYPALIAGKAYVRVSSSNGNIKRGDGVTSSTSPGVGMKATENGYVIGIAEEDYSEADTKQIGLVLIAVDPHFVQQNKNLLSSLFSLPRQSFSATPLNAIRYVLAGLIGIASFFIAFRFFGRASLEGIQAMGRNPLAKASIVTMVIINAMLTVGVMVVGFAVAYLILVI